MRSAPPIVLELRRSRRFELALAAVVVAAVAASFASGLPPPWRAACALAVLALAVPAVRANRRQHGVRLRLDPGGAAHWLGADGGVASLQLRDWTCLGPLVTLRLGEGRLRRDLFLLPDSADAESLRRLRVGLHRLHAPAQEPLG